MTDLEISKQFELKDIREVAKNINIEEEELELYGKYKAKISPNVYKNLKQCKNGKLVLVTAISPTPLGEGKTTIAIAIADGLRKIGEKSILALREPSLGPVFGVKGGATGGGRAQLAPMVDINLHFTGDIHAITSANNLLSAMIDNHIYSGNELEIETVTWKRCVDLNDRQLRVIQTGLSEESKIVPRPDGFDISVASEIMATLCLSEDIEDLKRRLGNIVIGYNKQGKAIFARDLKAQGAMAVLLKDAMKPNLIQTLEGTPCIMHGGPFANIAHGCNSIIATRLALKLGDYIITEAGFGADLGAEKFLNIKCRKANLTPDAVVCVATIKALKYHGGATKDELKTENLEFLKAGMENLYRHIDNLNKKFGLKVMVALNKFNNDTEAEISYLREELLKRGIELSLVESWEKGSDGAIDVAEKLVKLTEKPRTDINYTYDLKDSLTEKIEKVAKNIYGAEGIELSDDIKQKLEKFEKLGYKDFPVCIAKTQYSFSDNPKLLQINEPFKIHVQDVLLKTGAEFVVVIVGKIMTMPGLPKQPAAEHIDLDENGEIVGIF